MLSPAAPWLADLKRLLLCTETPWAPSLMVPLLSLAAWVGASSPEGHDDASSITKSTAYPDADATLMALTLGTVSWVTYLEA